MSSKWLIYSMSNGRQLPAGCWDIGFDRPELKNKYIIVKHTYGRWLDRLSSILPGLYDSIHDAQRMCDLKTLVFICHHLNFSPSKLGNCLSDISSTPVNEINDLFHAIGVADILAAHSGGAGTAQIYRSLTVEELIFGYWCDIVKTLGPYRQVDEDILQEFYSYMYSPGTRHVNKEVFHKLSSHLQSPYHNYSSKLTQIWSIFDKIPIFTVHSLRMLYENKQPADIQPS